MSDEQQPQQPGAVGAPPGRGTGDERDERDVAPPAERGGWQPIPHGPEYDAEGTAFVQLPPELADPAALPAGWDPLAAPGTGYTPPPMTGTPSQGGQWQPFGQSPVPGPGTHPGHPAGPHPQDPYAAAPSADPHATGHWAMPADTDRTGGWPAAGTGSADDSGEYPVAGPPGGQPGQAVQWPTAADHSVHTGQWSVPTAPESGDDSGEFAVGDATAAVQWPMTAPGGTGQWSTAPEQGAPAPGAADGAGELALGDRLTARGRAGRANTPGAPGDTDPGAADPHATVQWAMPFGTPPAGGAGQTGQWSIPAAEEGADETGEYVVSDHPGPAVPPQGHRRRDPDTVPGAGPRPEYGGYPAGTPDHPADGSGPEGLGTGHPGGHPGYTAPGAPDPAGDAAPGDGRPGPDGAGAAQPTGGPARGAAARPAAQDPAAGQGQRYFAGPPTTDERNTGADGRTPAADASATGAPGTPAERTGRRRSQNRRPDGARPGETGTPGPAQPAPHGATAPHPHGDPHPDADGFTGPAGYLGPDAHPGAGAPTGPHAGGDGQPGPGTHPDAGEGRGVPGAAADPYGPSGGPVATGPGAEPAGRHHDVPGAPTAAADGQVAGAAPAADAYRPDGHQQDGYQQDGYQEFDGYQAYPADGPAAAGHGRPPGTGPDGTAATPPAPDPTAPGTEPHPAGTGTGHHPHPADPAGATGHHPGPGPDAAPPGTDPHRPGTGKPAAARRPLAGAPGAGDGHTPGQAAPQTAGGRPGAPAGRRPVGHGGAAAAPGTDTPTPQPGGPRPAGRRPVGTGGAPSADRSPGAPGTPPQQVPDGHGGPRTTDGSPLGGPGERLRPGAAPATPHGGPADGPAAGEAPGPRPDGQVADGDGGVPDTATGPAPVAAETPDSHEPAGHEPHRPGTAAHRPPAAPAAAGPPAAPGDPAAPAAPGTGHDPVRPGTGHPDPAPGPDAATGPDTAADPDGPVDPPADDPAGDPASGTRPGEEPATGPDGAHAADDPAGAAATPGDVTGTAPDAATGDAPDGTGEDTGNAADAADTEPDAAAEAEPPHSEHPAASYVLRVNGTDRPVTDAWIGESLLYVLRERLGLAGAKDGCSQGECGACSVQVDGRLVASCLVPAATTAGAEIRTVEGLATDGQLSDVQRALTASGAVQCGFCVPGLAMTVHDLLEGNHAPTELETRQAICGNLCRCSGYRGVLEAVREVIAGRESAAGTGDGGPEVRIPHQTGPHGGHGGGNGSGGANA